MEQSNNSEFGRGNPIDLASLVESSRDPYLPHIGKWISIQDPQIGMHTGVYRGLTRGGNLVLEPYVAVETDIRSGASSRTFVNIDRPAYLAHTLGTGVTPVREEYVNQLINSPPYNSKDTGQLKA